MSNTAKKTEYNKTLASLYTTKNGNLYSLKVDNVNFDALQSVEIGGKLFIRFLSDETKDKIEARGKKAPEAFLEYMDAKKVAEEEAAYRARSGRGGGDDI